MDQEARWRAGWRPDEGHMTVPKSIEWLKLLRQQNTWVGDGLVVLSMFDGMGGCWQALKDLGIPVKKGYSCEIDPFANVVVKARFPEVVHLGSVSEVTKESIPEQVDLIVGGFPCQDLSFMGNQRGLHASRSGLYFHIPRLISLFHAKWFLVENVKCRWQDQAEISKYLLGVLPVEIDAEELSPQSRKRYYWTNLPLPSNLPGIKDHPETALAHFVHGAVATVAKINTVLTTNNAANTSRCALQCVYDVNKGGARYIEVDEIEVMMGYPPGYSNIPYSEATPTSRKRPPYPLESARKRAAGRQLFEGGAGGSNEGVETAQKMLKLEGSLNDKREASEGGGAEVIVEEVVAIEAKAIIALGSDEDEESLGKGTADEEGTKKAASVLVGVGLVVEEAPAVPLLGDSASGVNAAPDCSTEVALALVCAPKVGELVGDIGAGRGSAQGGPSGLSNEEKAEGGEELKERSPGYSLRARKPMNYNLDDQLGSLKYNLVPPRIRNRSTPRRQSCPSTPQQLSSQRLHELRWGLLGNSFVVPCIAYMLSPLLSAALRSRAERIVSIPAPMEKEACLFEPGEVWALYNEEKAPNWYARISKVDISCPQWDGRKKIPREIKLHYRFYEFTNAHGEDPDHPAHGVGVLQLSDDVYDSDSISFSHRVEPLALGGGRILVYPRQGDVWVVKDTRIHRFKMHVYIVSSSVDAATGKFECTVRDLVLQPRSTMQSTFYRMVGAERRVRSGSTIFSYQVPYFYKNEGGLLYVEPQNDASYRAGRAKQLKEDWDEEEEGVVAEEEELGAGEEAAEAEPELKPLPQIEYEQGTLEPPASVSLQLALAPPESPPVNETPKGKQKAGAALDNASGKLTPPNGKGKEKIGGVSDEETGSNEIAGVLPREERPTIKTKNVNVLMAILPQVPPPE